MPTNPFYQTTGNPAAQTRGSSALIRNEMALIQAGFDGVNTQFAATAASIATKGNIAGQAWTGTHDFRGAAEVEVPAPVNPADAVTLQTLTNAVSSAAGTLPWVSGTAYTVGQVVYSPMTFQNYRRVVAGAGATDPSLDGVNWVGLPLVKTLNGTPLTGSGNIVSTGLIPIGSLLAFDSDQSGNVIVQPNGDTFLKTGVVAPATTYPNAPSAPWGTVAAQALATLPFTPASIAYGNGVWVMGSYSTGSISTSTDTFNWNTAQALTGFASSGVTVQFANGIFVAINNVNGSVAKSPDGVNWTYGTLPNTSASWCALAYGNSIWVAAQSGGTNIATSPDGLTWTARTNSRSFTGGNPFVNGSPIAFGNGIFVLGDGGSVAAQLSTSADGINWTNRAITAPSTSWTNIAFGAGMFVYARNDSTYPLATSSDGINWTYRASSQPNNTTSIIFVNGVFQNWGYAWSADGINWTSGVGVYYAVAAATNGTTSMIVVNNSGNSSSYRTDSNAVTRWWCQVANGLQATWDSTSYAATQMAYGNGKFVSLTSTVNGQQGLSLDGKNWMQIPLGDVGLGVQYFNSQWIINGGSYMWTSPDGYKWASYARPLNLGNYLFVAGAKLFGQGSGTNYAYSLDGNTWSQGAWPSSFTPAVVCYGNSTYVAIATGASPVCMTSPDGLNWTQRANMPGGCNGQQMVFANGYFVFVDYNGNWWKSANGQAWTQMSLGYGNWPNTCTSVVTDGTNVYAAGGANCIMVGAAAGNSFYVRAMPSTISLVNSYNFVMGNGIIAARGYNTLYQQSFTPSATNMVLNDTNLKTYNATAASQTNFYKRVA